MHRTHYETLGVPEDAKDGEIAAAFRIIAKATHPDLHPGDKEAEDCFKAASAAYDTLADQSKRKIYDAELATARAKPAGIAGIAGAVLAGGVFGDDPFADWSPQFSPRNGAAKACEACGGAGVVAESVAWFLSMSMTCRACSGTGKATA